METNNPRLTPWAVCSVAPSCLTFYDPMDCSTPGFPVLHHLPELAQTHVHWVNDAIQPSHPLSPSSPPALNPSQHQGLFQGVSSPHQVNKVLELQLHSVKATLHLPSICCSCGEGVRPSNTVLFTEADSLVWPGCWPRAFRVTEQPSVK